MSIARCVLVLVAALGLLPAAAGAAPPALRHVGSFTTAQNLRAADPADTVTSAEIVDATADGRTLVYTDSPTGRVGFVDVTDPTAPRPGGTIDTGGEPTSVAVAGRYALVVVDTSPSFAAPSGELLVVDPARRAIVTRFALAGQPDSVAVGPSGRYAAIAIENERDEDAAGGLIPQAPPGTLQVLDLRGVPGRWAASLRTVDLTGLDMPAASDPEPEFVDVNRRDQAVVSLQENDHLAIVDLPTATVRSDFSAGTVSLDGIDTSENGLIDLDGGFTDRRREPDAVHWIDDETFATANEGDYTDAAGVEGGTRTVTIFDTTGRVVWDSGNGLEHAAVRAGRFPEDRAEDKGVEPEGLEVARLRGRTYLFVGLERANATVAYRLGAGAPVYAGLLPTGIGPEGLRAIARRDLFVVAAETDDPTGVRSLVTLYRLRRGPASGPQLTSADDAAGRPIPWAAISGLGGDPRRLGGLWAVSDAALAQGALYRIDTLRRPARITQRIPIGAADGSLDLEGVAARQEGGFWLASEGAPPERPDELLRADATGTILQRVVLPPRVAAAATTSGFEGVVVSGSAARGNETVWVAVQREWRDDPAGHVKLGRYDVASGTWTFARYPLDAPTSPSGGWVGLSELTLLGDGHTALVTERDDRLGAQARVKRLYRVDLTDPAVTWRPAGEPLDTVTKTLARDVLGDLAANGIAVPDKLEGVGRTLGGRVFLATDNDGLDDSLGQTLFFPLRAGIR